MTTRYLLRRGTAAEWAASNPVLADGEQGFDRTNHIVKVGDGVTAWNDLPGLSAEPGEDSGGTGLSAYDIAVANGFVGTEAEWLATLVGPQGERGPTGPEGPRGAPGTGIQIRDSLDNPSELPASGSTGDSYLIDGHIWVWNGSAFEDAGTIQGPEGPRGPQGPEGPQGESGASLTILGSFSNPGQLPTTGGPGEAYLVDGNIWVWNGTEFENAGSTLGPRQLAAEAEQKLRLWRIESNTLGTVERFEGWAGDAFLLGQDEVASNEGLMVRRSVDITGGSVGLRTDDKGIWTQQITPFDSSLTFGVNLESVATDGTQWVAVGANHVVTSPDGVNWTIQTTPVSTDFYDVEHNGNLWVVVGRNGTVLTSPDAIAWTLQTTPTTNMLESVAYAKNLWVVVGMNGTVITSPDAVTWTLQTIPTTRRLFSVATDGTQWVAVGQYTDVLTSPDGVNWTQQTTPTVGPVLYAITYGDGRWVAVGSQGAVLHSIDGVDWAFYTITENGYTVLFADITHDGERFLAVGSGRVLSSSTSASWESTSQVTPEYNRALKGIAHDGTRAVAVGERSALWLGEFGTADSGTVTFNTVALPSVCDSVYVMVDKTVDAGVIETYEATLDGGTTWEPVVNGEITALGHSGDQLALRFTHQRPSGGNEESYLFWIVGCGAQTRV